MKNASPGDRPRWYRVFATGSAEPDPERLLEHVRGLGAAAVGCIRRDDLGWFEATLAFPGTEAALVLHRYLASEDGVRDELNAWAAWLEHQPQGPELIQTILDTRQVIIMEVPARVPAGVDPEHLCAGVCRFLAGLTGGVYQADGAGFFDAGGSELAAEA